MISSPSYSTEVEFPKNPLLPLPNTPGAPNLSDNTSFIFTPFGSMPSFDDDEYAERSLFSGTSANSSVLFPTPVIPVADRAFPRVFCHPLSSLGHSRPSFGSGINGERSSRDLIGLGLMGVFKQDGTLFSSVSTLSRGDEDGDLPSFLDDYFPDDPFLFEEFIDESLSTPSIDRVPSPRLLDDVFSSLALTKSSTACGINSSSHSPGRSASNDRRVMREGPEEPEYDDVFIERGRVTREHKVAGTSKGAVECDAPQRGKE